MFPYLLIMSIPAILSFSQQKRQLSWLSLFPVFLIYVLFTGFRDHVGMDWNNYLGIFASTRDMDISDIMERPQFGFMLLNWASRYMDWEIYGVNAVCALIFCFGLFSFARKMPNPWLALLVVSPYLVMVISMSAIRQAAAIGVLLYLFANWRTCGLMFKVTLIILAVTFHTSAIIFFLFVVFDMKSSWFVKAGAVAVTVAMALVIASSDNEQATYYSETYSDNSLVSGGAFAHVLLSAFPGFLYLALKKRWVSVYGHNAQYDMLAWLSIISLPAVMVSSTGVDRLALYFSAIQMIVYSGLPGLYQSGTGSVIRFSMVILAFFLMVFWLTFGNTSVVYIPYNNILLNIFD